ncbi:FAD-dependent monooxygenase [Pseudonocardia sp. GCM10023141]|uniref:FAD-dependent monooxygenase n=1 Tax=Pseudonocardia sp. GCM10023141 TaxID=3252653 RepID=UPI00361CBEE6
MGDAMIDVLVAGAGPTGLTTALQIARAGHGVRIVDAAPSAFIGSRGDGMQPRTQEVFDDLGVSDAVRAGGMAPPPFRITIGGEFAGMRSMFEVPDATTALPYPSAWMMPQWRTEQILRDRLAEFAVSVEFGTALAAATQDGDGVTATLARDGVTETVRAAYLVGADGGRSTVRKQLGIPFLGETDEDFRMVLGDVAAPELDHTVSHWFATAENPMAGAVLMPLQGTDLFQFGVTLAGAGTPTLEYLQSQLDALTGERRIALTRLHWGTVWRPNIRMAERFRDGRAFLAGDAAHVHPPTGGQGLNTGVQDGYNLGWKLAAVLDGADPGLLDSYEAERLPIAASVLGLSTAIMEKYRDGDETAGERGRDTQQLDLHYRGSALSVTDADVLAELQAGDRVPDGLLADGSRLFDAFRGPHATVLGIGVAVSDLARAGVHAVRIDESSDAATNLDAKPGAVLVVRPDGYLGYVGDAAAGARSYLETITCPARR